MSRSLSLAAVVSFAVVIGCTSETPLSPALRPSFVNEAQPFTPGEQQPVADSRGFVYAIYPNGVGQNLAQTFTPSDNQRLGYLEIPVGCAAGVLLNVKIREGIGGAILCEANVAGLPTIVDGTFQLIQVYDPAVSKGIKLHKGTEYAFELAAFPGPGATENSCGMNPGPAGNSYAGGKGYFQDPITGPDFLPLPNGAPTDDEDLPFITLVR